jgi:hypothetical protein
MVRCELGLREDISKHGPLAATSRIDVALPALEASLDRQVGLGMCFERRQQQQG